MKVYQYKLFKKTLLVLSPWGERRVRGEKEETERERENPHNSLIRELKQEV